MLLGIMTALRRRRPVVNEVPGTVTLRPDPQLYSAYKGMADDNKMPLANAMLLTLQQVIDAAPSAALEVEDYNKLLLSAQRVRAAMRVAGLPLQYISQIAPGLTPADFLSDRDLIGALTPDVIRDISKGLSMQTAWLLGGKTPPTIEEGWAQYAHRMLEAAQEADKAGTVTLFLVRLNTAEWEKVALDDDDWTPSAYLMPLLRWERHWDAKYETRLVTYRSWSPERYTYQRSRLNLRTVLAKLDAAHIRVVGLGVTQETWNAYREGNLLPDQLINANLRGWSVDVHVPGQTTIPHLKDEEKYLNK